MNLRIRIKRNKKKGKISKASHPTNHSTITTRALDALVVIRLLLDTERRKLFRLGGRSAEICSGTFIANNDVYCFILFLVCLHLQQLFFRYNVAAKVQISGKLKSLIDRNKEPLEAFRVHFWNLRFFENFEPIIAFCRIQFS